MRKSILLLPLVALTSLVGACAPSDDPDDDPEAVAVAESAQVAGDAELRFVDRVYATFVASANETTYASLKDTAGSANPSSDKSSYYRMTCSLALVGAVWARAHRTSPSPMVATWIREATNDYRNFSLAAWGHHVRLAPAVDCLLAGSVATPWLSGDDRRRLREAAIAVTSAAPSPSDFRSIGAAWPGNSQAEEAALAADFLYLASRLTVAGTDARRKQWNDRAGALFRYASSIPIAGTKWAGEPFRRNGSAGQPLGPDEAVVTNHGLETSPYYSLGALISYADATMVARALGERLPPGISLDGGRFRETTDGPEREQLGVRDIVEGGMRRVDRTTFGFRGGYRFVGEDGRSNVQLDYGTQTHTIPFFPPNNDLMIRTNDVGTVAQYVEPINKSVRGYQIDGTEIRAYECANEPRGWFCRARFKGKLSDLWSTGNVADQSRFGGRAMPAANVEAMPQWIDRNGALHTEVFSGGRVWHYVCTGTTLPRQCRAVDSIDLATHFSRHGFSGSTMPPTDGVDAASAFIHLDGTGRRYWTRGNRIYRARCSADFTGCTVSSESLANQFGGLSFPNGPALPTDRLDALTQTVRDGVLATYVFRGDRIWKYECTTTSCTARLTQTIANQWGGITNQERWADRTADTLRGVTDWGVQATMMNATFALAHVLGADGGAYADLVRRQRDGVHLETRPLFPSTFDPATGAFGYGAFRGAYPVGRHGAIQVLQDGWAPTHLGPRERLNTFTWMNAFAGRNHAVAYLLESGAGLVNPL